MKNIAPEAPARWFTLPSAFEVAGVTWYPEEIIEILGPHISEGRRATVDAVADSRSFGVATVVDGLYDRGNTSAVMRTAEGLGFAPMHIVETQKRFKKANRVTQGSDKWLEISRWEESQPCAEDLKAKGYQIITTHLEAAVPLNQVDFTIPTAIVLGNEREGVSEAMLAHSDQNVIIPMSGFAQSFNISVAAAICLYHIRLARDRAGLATDLTYEQRRIVLAEYYLRSVGTAHKILSAHRVKRNKVDGVA